MNNLLIVEKTFTCICGKQAKGFMYPEGWWQANIYNQPKIGRFTVFESVSCSSACLRKDIEGKLS